MQGRPCLGHRSLNVRTEIEQPSARPTLADRMPCSIAVAGMAHERRRCVADVARHCRLVLRHGRVARETAYSRRRVSTPPDRAPALAHRDSVTLV